MSPLDTCARRNINAVPQWTSELFVRDFFDTFKMLHSLIYVDDLRMWLTPSRQISTEVYVRKDNAIINITYKIQSDALLL